MSERPPILNTKIYSAALVALPAILGEAAQHLIEFQFGMYVRGDGIAAGYETNVRMIGAAVKVIGFVSTIFLALSRSRILVGAKSKPLTTRGLAIALPLLVHHALNYAVVGKPNWIVMAMISLDCLVIGSIALALGLVMPQKRMRKLP